MIMPLDRKVQFCQVPHPDLPLKGEGQHVTAHAFRRDLKILSFALYPFLLFGRLQHFMALILAPARPGRSEAVLQSPEFCSLFI